MAALEVARMTVWLRKFVIELSVFSSVHDPMRNPFDYQGVIANAKETRSHSAAKTYTSTLLSYTELCQRR